MFEWCHSFHKNMKLFSTLIIIINVKGHVTLKTGVMMINSALITGINYTLLYIHIENR